MKVVFIEDVPDIALAGETRDVADGYGRNYLLPKKLAVLADAAAWMDCTLHDRFAAGTHTIYVGQVEASEVPEPRGTTGKPLSRQYFRTAATSSVEVGSATASGAQR